MITSFEVGSVFQIVDKASPTILTLQKRMVDFTKIVSDTKKELQSLGSLKLGALQTNLKAATDQVIALTDAVDRAAGRITGSTKTAEASVQQLTAQWRQAEKAALAAGTAARSSGVPLVGGRGGGNPRQGIGGAHAGGRSSLHLPSFSSPMPGGGHVKGRLGGDAEMAAGLLIGAAAYEEAQIEDSISLMLWHASQAPTAANKQSFRNLIQSTASQTGFSYHDIAEAATDEIRLLKGTPGKGLDILPEMLKAAATESRLKGTSLDNSMQALIGLAHMEKGYSAEEIKTMAPMLGFLSTANPQNLKQMETAASYAMPLLQSQLNMDPSDVLFSTTALARAGALNTKSGTWVRSAFERALPPDAHTMNPRQWERRVEEMRELGLVDASGKSTILDAAGTHIDIEKFLDTVRTHADSMDIAKRNSYIKGVFGEQGSRGIDMLMDPKVREQEHSLKAEFPDWKNKYATFMEDYSRQSPVQQFRQSWQDLLNVLTDIGQVALPGLLNGLKQFDELLKLGSKITSLAQPGSLGNVAAKGAAAAATGGLGFDGFLDSIKQWWSQDAAKKSLSEGAAKGTEEGVISGFHKMMFEGGSFDKRSGLIRTSYETVGDGGGFTTVNGVTVPNGNPGSAPMGITGSTRTIKRADGSVVRVPHFNTADIAAAIGQPLSGNSYIAARRSAFAAELSDPSKRLQFAGMLLSEGNPLQTAESAMNRSDMTHKTLMQSLLSGFYGPINKGQLPKFMAQLQRNPKLMAQMDAAIRGALAGSDTIKGFTDQGMVSDPNGGWILRHDHLWGKGHGNIYGDWGGGGGHAASERWRHEFEAGANAPGTTDSAATVSPAPKSAREIHLHNSTILDGRVIAKNSMRHIAKEGNRPAAGGRMPDYLTTRPLSI